MQFIFITVLFIIASIIETLEISIINPSKASLMATLGDNNVTKQILKLKENSASVLIVILILDTALHSLTNLLVFRYFENIISSNFGWSVFTVCFTAFSIYLSILSKILALNYSKITARFFAYPFSFIFSALKPLGTFFTKIGDWTFFLLGMKPMIVDEVDNYKKELFFTLVEGKKLSHKMEEIIFMEHLLSLRDVNIEKIMTSRRDFDTIEWDNDVHKMTEQLVNQEGRKRMIVYENNDDNIIGTLDVQKFLATIYRKNLHNIKDLIESPTFFVETTDVYRVLKFFSNTKQKLLFVTDEYGSVKGIVSLTDILSEIFGDIDNDDEFFEETKDGIVVSGTYNIRILNRKMGWKLPDDCITVGGLLINVAKRIPQEGNVFPYQGYKFLVLKRNRNHIEKILIRDIHTELIK